MPNKCLPSPLEISEILRSAPAALEFVLPGLPLASVGGLVSPGGVGKSFWALSLALSIATGRALVGLKLKEGRVLYLSAEDPAEVIALRLRSYCQDLAQCGPVLKEVPLLDIRCCFGMNLDLMSPQCLADISQAAQGYRLIVVDTLSRFHNLDENSARDMKLLMASLEQLAVTSGAAVLYLHHTSKLSVTQNQASWQQSARGSSVLVDNARWASFLAPMTDQDVKVWGLQPKDKVNYVRWNISKQNYGEAVGDRWYRRGNEGQLIHLGETVSKRIATKSAAKPVELTPAPQALLSDEFSAQVDRNALLALDPQEGQSCNASPPGLQQGTGELGTVAFVLTEAEANKSFGNTVKPFDGKW